MASAFTHRRSALNGFGSDSLAVPPLGVWGTRRGYCDRRESIVWLDRIVNGVNLLFLLMILDVDLHIFLERI